MANLQQSELIEFVSPQTLKPHPLNVAIYGDGGYQDLIDSIKELGILQALYVTSKNVILSGHRRWRAAMAAECPAIPIIRMNYTNELDERQAIIEHNRYRIKNGQQLYNEGKELEKIEKVRAEQRMLAGKKADPTEIFPEGQGETRNIVANAIGLGSGKQWEKLGYVADHKPELLTGIHSGGTTIHQAYVQTRRAEVRKNVGETKWPTGKYRVIYADPPWSYSNTQPDYHTVQDDHYPTMSLAEICALPIIELALDNAVLFLWATSPILEDAFKVINSWGFKYKASFVWDKIKHNMGHYNSVRHEFLLVAVRGSCPPDVPKLYDSVQTVERNEHSTKPEIFREIISTLYPHGPRIELFARRELQGWERYGNEIR